MVQQLPRSRRQWCSSPMQIESAGTAASNTRARMQWIDEDLHVPVEEALIGA